MDGTTRFSQPPESCRSCLAWGRMAVAGWCAACYQFAFKYDVEQCGGCGRSEPARNGYCRLCWHQAREDGLASGNTAKLPKPATSWPGKTATTSCSSPT